jgi:hypothetical protein
MWRGVSAISWWLIGHLAKVMHVHQSKAPARAFGTENLAKLTAR